MISKINYWTSEKCWMVMNWALDNKMFKASETESQMRYLFMYYYIWYDISFFLLLLVEVCAVLKLDNCYVGQTSWKTLGKDCWSQQFHIELDKVKKTRWFTHYANCKNCSNFCVSILYKNYYNHTSRHYLALFTQPEDITYFSVW